MHKELLFSLASPSRDDLSVYGFRFGSGAKRLAIVTGLNGDELSGMFIASQLVAFFTEQVKKNKNFFNGEVLIIPSVNHFAFNMGMRFWPLDNTDLNVMFPGYDKGETTQRIADMLFKSLDGYELGIVMEDRKDRAKCLPYIKLIDSPFIDIDQAKQFGLSLIHIKDFSPTDSGSLLYNWGVWNTKAFSLVVGNKGAIEPTETKRTLESILQFMTKQNIINYTFDGAQTTERVIYHKDVVVIKTLSAGIFQPAIATGALVSKDDVLGTIFDSLTGEVKERIKAPMNGMVTCMYNYPLIFQHSVAFRMIEVKQEFYSMRQRR